MLAPRIGCEEISECLLRQALILIPRNPNKYRLGLRIPRMSQYSQSIKCGEPL